MHRSWQSDAMQGVKKKKKKKKKEIIE